MILREQTVSGVPGLVYQNSWSQSSNFKRQLEFMPSFDGDFYGYQLKWNLDLHPTTVWYKYEDRDESYSPEYTGPLYLDLMILGKMLNFTLGINTVKEACSEEFASHDSLYRRVSNPTKFLENFILLEEKKIHLAGGDLIASYEMYQRADISAPMFYQVGANIVSVEPDKTLQWYAIFQPFQLYVWIMILAVIPLTGSVLYLLRKYSEAPDKAPSWGDSFWDATVVLCWDGIRSPQPPASVIILLSSYMLAIFLLISEYMGSFTSFMIMPAYVRPPVESLEQLRSMDDMMWLGGRMTSYYVKHFNNLEMESRARIMLEKDDVPESPVAIGELLSNPDNLVYFEKEGLIKWSVCHYNITLNGRKLYYSKETIGDYYTYLYLQKGSIATELFNRKIMVLQDMGIIEYHQRLFNAEKIKIACLVEVANEAEIITLIHMMVGFYLLILGYGLALISLIAEMILHLRENVIRLNHQIRELKKTK